MRGGVSYIANQCGKASNMEEYDENAPSKYIMYLDAIHIYLDIQGVSEYMQPKYIQIIYYSDQ